MILSNFLTVSLNSLANDKNSLIKMRKNSITKYTIDEPTFFIKVFDWKPFYSKKKFRGASGLMIYPLSSNS